MLLYETDPVQRIDNQHCGYWWHQGISSYRAEYVLMRFPSYIWINHYWSFIVNCNDPTPPNPPPPTLTQKTLHWNHNKKSEYLNKKKCTEMSFAKFCSFCLSFNVLEQPVGSNFLEIIFSLHLGCCPYQLSRLAMGALVANIVPHDKDRWPA